MSSNLNVKVVEQTFNQMFGIKIGEVCYFYDASMKYLGWQPADQVHASKRKMNLNGVEYTLAVYSKTKIKNIAKEAYDHAQMYKDTSRFNKTVKIDGEKGQLCELTLGFSSFISAFDKFRTLIRMAFVLNELFESRESINCIQVHTDQSEFESLLDLLPAAKLSDSPDKVSCYFVSKTQGHFASCKIVGDYREFSTVGNQRL